MSESLPTVIAFLSLFLNFAIGIFAGTVLTKIKNIESCIVEIKETCKERRVNCHV